MNLRTLNKKVFYEERERERVVLTCLKKGRREGGMCEKKSKQKHVEVWAHEDTPTQAGAIV